jgi:N-acyl-D-aspartate/D-glutamate deacylase
VKAEVDLVIRNGTIFDGTGGEPYVADIAIAEGKIVVVGSVAETGREEIDASGKMVTPGFIDVHTHYDGQLTWDERVSPSSAHGVTTVVTGNCGVGFAPCRAEDHDRLIKLLEGVEDMPEIVLAEGLTWDWETFPEFIEALKRRKHDIDFAVQLPHAAVRMYVMGDRAVDHAVATEEDLVQMRAIAREAIEAGAVGFGTSRTIMHTTLAGEIIPTAHAPETELRAIAEGMAEAGGGVFQAQLDHTDLRSDLKMVRRVAADVGAPLSFTLLPNKYDKDIWKDVLVSLDIFNDGSAAPVTGQVLPRPLGFLLGLDLSYNPFSTHPAYCAIAGLPLAERVAEMRKPEVRAAILADEPEQRDTFQFEHARRFETIFELGSSPNYEPAQANSIAAIAAARGVSPYEVAYDMLLEDGGHALLMQTLANYEDYSLDPVRAMITHPNTVPALGDGGAHYGMVCDSTYTTFMLTYWGRDRKGARIALPEIVRKMSGLPAALWGFADRGRIAVGLKADINVIDFDKLTLHAPRVIRDLPSDGRRLNQEADGYIATIVNGETIMQNGKPTGALPGRLVERSRVPEALAAA